MQTTALTGTPTLLSGGEAFTQSIAPLILDIAISFDFLLKNSLGRIALIMYGSALFLHIFIAFQCFSGHCLQKVNHYIRAIYMVRNSGIGFKRRLNPLNEVKEFDEI